MTPKLNKVDTEAQFVEWWQLQEICGPQKQQLKSLISLTKNQVPPVTEENRVAFFSSDHRPSDVVGELLFFLQKGKYLCDVMIILQPY